MWGLAVKFVPMTIIFFLGAQAVVLGGTWLVYTRGISDPFAPYEAIMPGQWVEASGEAPCDLQLISVYMDEIGCQIHPKTGPFVSVTSNVFDGRFVQIWFRSHDLYVGDLVRRWGRPEVVARGSQAFYVLWEDQGLYGIINPVGSFGHFSYWLPIERFTIGLRAD